MLARLALERAPALVGELELDDHTVNRHRVGLGVREHVASNDRVAIEHVELAVPAILDAYRVYSPAHDLSGWQRGLDVLVFEVRVDLGLVAHRNRKNSRRLCGLDQPCKRAVRDGRIVRTLLCRVGRTGEERLDGRRLRGVAAHIRHHSAEFLLLHDAVETGNHFLERADLVYNLELEKGGLLHDIGGAGCVADARQLHDDAIGPDLLHHGLCHAELVHARTHDLQRAFEGIGLVRNRALGLVHFEGEVHAAL